MSNGWVCPLALAAMLGLTPVVAMADRDFVSDSTVGMAKTLRDVVLPGSRLQVRGSSDRHDPFVLRIIDTYKHGSDHRYDLEYYALEPGDYNVVAYLVPEDGKATAELPEMWVRVTETRSADQFQPAAPGAVALPRLGGYRLFWIVGGTVWFVGLLLLIFGFRKRAAPPVAVAEKPRTMADQLRPLVQAARDGSLDAAGEARLERTLIAYWSERLQLAQTAPGEVTQRLKQHAEAGPLFQALERWLHMPERDKSVDLEGLLEPYRNVAAEPMPRTTATTPAGANA